nr:unnamed protein product [Digitaria exilis]
MAGAAVLRRSARRVARQVAAAHSLSRSALQQPERLLSSQASPEHGPRGAVSGSELALYPPERVRNFSIIAHVDHGKSTLADRLLELTGTIQKGHGQPQYLDKLQIDQPTADPDNVKEQLKRLFDIDPSEALLTSAKTGKGLEQVLPAVIARIPSPPGKCDSPVRMLLLDSYYDEYKGVICHVAVVDGALRKGDKIASAATGRAYEVLDVGIMHPELTPTGVLYTGQVGYVISGMRSTKEARIGDTLHQAKSTVEPLPGFKPAKHMVFSGLYPADGSDFEALSHAIEKLTCNDASVSVTKETSNALGMGFRCGFLGLLHMDVFHQRLEQEYGAQVISTIPTVPYIFEYGDGSQRALLKYRLPLKEIIVDFYNELKGITSGYATFDYEDSEYQQSDLVKMDILLNGQPVDAMATIVHNQKAQRVGRELVEKLKKFIERQMFEITIQAAIGSKVIARETLSAMRKNVLAKCYGGDITRKKKLLEKQKEGKKRMKRVGSVDIPQEAFHELLKVLTIEYIMTGAC